ncbi:MAG: arsenosugar biosynthesis radical SAM protein ArsS [Oceanospirillaceae bacterium]|nr:arsenosugar biosynthesis radical SAM protein ArsS [Oceanospirillaceae bacterium]MCP5335344.1 arsenosugar biosynthesis radical SAM protein ArsS [Oceanospirillaceae bacterium]MCP5350703.1 arsenosugar biosynthesis radical SAM protein ArsS [Oceanospirillaceae bacterium]
MLDSKPLLIAREFPAIRRQRLEILQVNLGYRCNLSCTHCHVNAGPRRTEMMDAQGIELVLQAIKRLGIKSLDLTGGAPELHPQFRYLVAEARAMGCEVIDRCNLTILQEPGQEDLAEFLAQQGVTVVASMPCYTADNVDKQRGKGVFDGSIAALKALNLQGYGMPGSGLHLNLVYNPGGAFLPPSQQKLQADYKQRLLDDWGIHFNELFTITNMPIARFGSQLITKGEFTRYMQLLIDNYQPQNLHTVMCRNTISVDWQGYLYDCDFNQMLEMGLQTPDGERRHLRELITTDLSGEPIMVAGHCFGCTAGQGSSCGGALA